MYFTRRHALQVCAAALAVRAVRPSLAAEAYAPEKARTCLHCAKLLEFWRAAIPLPKHGAIMSYASFLSTESTFDVLDIDVHNLSRCTTKLERNPDRLVLTSSNSVALSDAELSVLIDTVNRIWRDPQPVKSHLVTDASWSLLLVDEPTLKEEAGMGNPDGLAKKLQTQLHEARVNHR